MDKPEKILELEKRYNIVFNDLDKEYSIDNYNRMHTFKLDNNGNVIELCIRINENSDFSFLKEFRQLISLELGYSQISNIYFLKDLTQLTSLNLLANQISDISVLKNLTQLTSLNLIDNQILDISPLKELKQLISLQIGFNQISDISPLKELRLLNNLYLKQNQISDISFLKELTLLKSLNLEQNQISDISFLKNLIQLTFLELYGNEISDISPLMELKQLTSLNLGFNKISNVSFLKNLQELTYLNISNNQISDISFLEKLSKLISLDTSNNQIIDITFLKELIQLSELNLSLNNISDIHILDNLKKIKTLYLSNNFISDLSQFEFIIKNSLLTLRTENNPYFSYNNIILKSDENHYGIVLNELKKLGDSQIKAVLPEKIILLGNHASGKSSLLYYLQNEKLDYNHDSTHILKIEKYPKDYDILPKAIIYDFGGQDFYHGIYQTFLTSQSITLLFWNTQTNKNIILLKEDSKSRPNRNFNVTYWLGQRKHKEISGEVLLIQTNADDENSRRQSYINSHQEILNEFYISLEKENIKIAKNKLKHLALQYLKESINDVIKTNQKQKNNGGKISKPYYEFVKYILETLPNHKSIKKEVLKKYYKIESKERFEIDIEQLKRQGLILIHEDNVWLNPVALTEYVHTEILKENIIGNGIIEESIFKSYKFDANVIELLIKEKVIFYHKFGLSINNEIQNEYIIPNYLPQIISSGIDYDLMAFGLDNPLFVLKFKDYLPFGLINQLICYFGRLPDRKKFWREHLIFTIDKNVKILIELDFEQLKIKVFGVYIKDSTSIYKNNIEQYLFYIIMGMYWDFDLLPKNLNEFNDLYKKITYQDKKTRESEETIVESFMTNFYINPDCRPDDLFISKDDKIYIKYDSLCNINDNQTKIQTYTFDDEKKINEYVEKPISIYQNFTHKRLKTMKKVFISYSHDDLRYRKDLQTYLVNLERENKIEIWHDGLIDAGIGWNEKIIKKLEESDIIILLISQTFISSKYIHEVEMKKALEQKLEGLSKIVPILVSNCDWNNWNVFLDNENIFQNEEEVEKGKLNNYQFIPMNEGKQRLEAINRWQYPEDAWTKIIKQIRDYTNV